MSLKIPFDNSYATLSPRFFTRMLPEPVADPTLLAFNPDLAAELGVIPGDDAELARVFGGNEAPAGAAPLAQVYAGHQFGGFVPQLGDGRAVLLGEVVDTQGQRRDIQLKGSGRTPYSRQGDGRAWLGPVLREYLLSEAMHALGLPTTRALAAVATGESVYRESALPGAVLTRVAQSHIRVGTFQYFAARRDETALQELFTHARERHYPDAKTPADFLRAVIRAQVSLVVRWLSIGFIHGVMNTDNTSISGETIDYGPAAFMDTYHPVTVYSSIDHQGRYAYDNQPNVLAWNMAQLATALVPLMPDSQAAVTEFTEAVHAMGPMIQDEWLRVFGAKIGLHQIAEGDEALIGDLLGLMQQGQVDFTNGFRALAIGDAGGEAGDHFTNRADFDHWQARWQERIQDAPDPQALMQQVNPAFIPRNHRVEQMIQAAVAGDLAPFWRLNQVLSRPYEEQPDAQDLTQPPRPDEVVQATFCGT